MWNLREATFRRRAPSHYQKLGLARQQRQRGLGVPSGFSLAHVERFSYNPDDLLCETLRIIGEGSHIPSKALNQEAGK
jgi:hypothetical protein